MRHLFIKKALSADAAGELNVLGHEGDTLGMDGTQVAVLIQPNKVGLGCFLQGKHCRSLPFAFPFFVTYLGVLGEFANKPGEGELSKQ